MTNQQRFLSCSLVLLPSWLTKMKMTLKMTLMLTILIMMMIRSPPSPLARLLSLLMQHWFSSQRRRERSKNCSFPSLETPSLSVRPFVYPFQSISPSLYSIPKGPNPSPYSLKFFRQEYTGLYQNPYNQNPYNHNPYNQNP